MLSDVSHVFILLSAVQTDVFLLLASNSQHFCVLRVASVCTPCSNSLRVVGSCCAKFETCQTFNPTTPNISFFSMISGAKRKNVGSVLHSSSHIVGATYAHHTWSKIVWVVFLPRCTGASNFVGNERNMLQQRIFTLSLKEYRPVILERGYPSTGSYLRG